MHGCGTGHSCRTLERLGAKTLAGSRYHAGQAGAQREREVMTEEEKIEAVEHALDGHAELITAARDAFLRSWLVLLDEFCYGVYGGPECSIASDYFKRLEAVLGKTEAIEIDNAE